MNLQQSFGLIGWLLVSYVAAAIGGAATFKAQPFYSELARPAWAPPAWVFGPVWTLLYTLMGIAAWLVWRQAGNFRAAWVPLSLFVVQLMLNALWSWLFFSWNSGRWSFIELLILWSFIAATLVLFWNVRPLAGSLLIPYLLWVSFAGALNYAVWKLNPGIL